MITGLRRYVMKEDGSITAPSFGVITAKPKKRNRRPNSVPPLWAVNEAKQKFQESKERWEKHLTRCKRCAKANAAALADTENPDHRRDGACDFGSWDDAGNRIRKGCDRGSDLWHEYCVLMWDYQGLDEKYREWKATT